MSLALPGTQKGHLGIQTHRRTMLCNEEVKRQTPCRGKAGASGKLENQSQSSCSPRMKSRRGATYLPDRFHTHENYIHGFVQDEEMYTGMQTAERDE